MQVRLCGSALVFLYVISLQITLNTQVYLAAAALGSNSICGLSTLLQIGDLTTLHFVQHFHEKPENRVECIPVLGLVAN